MTHVGGRSSRHSARASLEAFHRSAFRLYWKHASAPARLLAPLVFGALQVRLAFMKQIVRRRSGAVTTRRRARRGVSTSRAAVLLDVAGEASCHARHREPGVASFAFDSAQ